MGVSDFKFCLVFIHVYLMAWTIVRVKTARLLCDYDNNTLTLNIERGFVEEEVVDCLQSYPTAENLVLIKSGLTLIPRYLDILKDIVSLDLSHNEIRTVSFYGLEQICNRIKRLVLDYNAIHVLRKGNLDCFESLEKFFIANNNLEQIENGTFSTKLKSIDYIHLVNNNLTKLDSSLISRISLQSDIHSKINASFNRIKGFTNSLSLTIDDVSPASSIDVIILHNNITSVDIDYYFNMFNVTHPVPQLFRLWNSAFDARFNPFICDCSLYPLAKALKVFYKMDRDNPVFSITCGSPPTLEGMMVRKVKGDQFNCSVSKNCPESCKCIKTIALELITVSCLNGYHDNDLPTTCPTASNLHINMKSNQMTQLSARKYLQNVTVLDASQCSISDIGPSVVKAFGGGITQAVYLHGNNLEYLPPNFQTLNFSEGQILTIDGNPFKCDCHSLWMKKWLLSNKKHVLNQDRIKCSSGANADKPVISVPDNEFTCETGLAFKRVITIIAVSLSGIILLTTVIACKFNSIQVFMISNCGLCKYCFRRRKQRRLLNDIFIAHSSDDDVLIENIVHFLESQTPAYKVCLAEKNFIPGKTISECILNAIETSHTTLMVISNNFLRSAWCNMEFREAHMRFLKDRNINMVLVVLEELDKKLIYKELSLYLKTHVYIKFTDRYFWAKLLQSIPIMIPNDTETTPLLSN